ncbi:MAG: Crp/Fnr family transcriptional regulator [Candidatus Pseudobacter hemicellulosilyticus]|uniref:Crp/Fnr family transcriptional regulator n=1 Tax=Candidatus Pseudobacter hemicellulosilyticus TaxID=3121375 RepID=A0AAJ5WZ61_9BACT|nr:MAG: Crp/Fnr family transcriptional regulator [Pseudobacter sp.]
MAFELNDRIGILQRYLDQLYRSTGRLVTLSVAELTTLAELMTLHTYSRREVMVRIGDHEPYLHFVITGLVRTYFFKGEEEVVTQLAKEGDLVGSTISFFSGKPSDYMVEALEPSTMLSIPRAKMEQLYRYSIEINKLARVILTDHLLQKETWELVRLKYNIRERFLLFIENNQELFLRVPQKYQASYLNIKPETFSRLKTQVTRRMHALSSDK